MPTTTVQALAAAASPGDALAELREVFRRAGEGGPAVPFADHAEEVWLTPYVEHQPESLLLARLDGRVVGYLTGCVDGAALPGEDERVERMLSAHRLYLRPAVARFLVRCLVDLARAGRGGSAAAFTDPAYPAHLHVRLVPAARGHGLGGLPVERFLDRLRELGSPGCHLQTERENPRAVAFFERHGFVRHGPAMPIPGLRGHRGERLHQQTMVWRP